MKKLCQHKRYKKLTFDLYKAMHAQDEVTTMVVNANNQKLNTYSKITLWLYVDFVHNKLT